MRQGGPRTPTPQKLPAAPFPSAPGAFEDPRSAASRARRVTLSPNQRDGMEMGSAFLVGIPEAGRTLWGKLRHSGRDRTKASRKGVPLTPGPLHCPGHRPTHWRVLKWTTWGPTPTPACEPTAKPPPLLSGLGGSPSPPPSPAWPGSQHRNLVNLYCYIASKCLYCLLSYCGRHWVLEGAASQPAPPSA